MRNLVLGVLMLAALAAAAYLYASSLPVEIRAERTRTLNAPVERVFALVTDVAAQPTWRKDVATVQVDDGGRRWVEQTRQGVVIAFEEAARTPVERYEISFSSPQGFTGYWIGVFAPSPDGKTQVTFTETVRTESPIGRLMQRLFATPGAHIDLYLSDLEAALAARSAP